MKYDISVIVPVYNEEKNIPILFDRLRKAISSISENFEIIFVNDGSKDLSIFEIINLSEIDNRVYFINFSRNFGHQVAVSAGIDNCRGDVAIIIDSDLQDPPELIPELYKKHREGYEVVYAKRIKRKGDSIFKKATAKIFYRLLRNMTEIDIPLDTGDFRLINKKIVNYLKMMPEKNKFLRGQIAWLGFKQTHVPFEREERVHGKTGYSFSKMLKFALDGITGFSDIPLRFVTKAGFFVSLVSFFIILYSLYSHFILHQTITGWTSIIICTMFIGGIQLFSIGVLGEYISRMNKIITNRPLYIIEKTNISEH